MRRLSIDLLKLSATIRAAIVEQIVRHRIYAMHVPTDAEFKSDIVHILGMDCEY